MNLQNIVCKLSHFIENYIHMFRDIIQS